MKRYLSVVIFSLIIFLPFSAWLVSLFGDFRLALGRDILILLLVPVALSLYKKTQRSWLLWTASAFLVFLLCSFFWREENLAQWLRGVRFYGAPIALAAIAYLVARKVDLEKIWTVVAWTVVAVALAGFVEYLFPQLIRFSFVQEAVRGQLDYFHLAGDFARMQATLAGPNALGLFLAFALLAFPLFSSNYRRSAPLVYLVLLGALVLTFSRSSLIGYLVPLMIAGVIINPIWRRPRMAFLAVALAITLGAGVYNLLIDDPTRQLSTEIRLQQYQRVVQNWDEIGLVGRGPGSAGLVSQYRFDSKENYYTENIYLDIFEGLGLIGLLLYLLLWGATLRLLFLTRTPEGFWLGMSGLGLLVAGFFISHYTGQAAIFYFWLMTGLTLGRVSKDEDRA